MLKNFGTYNCKDLKYFQFEFLDENFFKFAVVIKFHNTYSVLKNKTKRKTLQLLQFNSFRYKVEYFDFENRFNISYKPNKVGLIPAGRTIFFYNIIIQSRTNV